MNSAWAKTAIRFAFWKTEFEAWKLCKVFKKLVVAVVLAFFNIQEYHISMLVGKDMKNLERQIEQCQWVRQWALCAFNSDCSSMKEGGDWRGGSANCFPSCIAWGEVLPLSLASVSTLPLLPTIPLKVDPILLPLFKYTIQERWVVNVPLKVNLLFLNRGKTTYCIL